MPLYTTASKLHRKRSSDPRYSAQHICLQFDASLTGLLIHVRPWPAAAPCIMSARDASVPGAHWQRHSHVPILPRARGAHCWTSRSDTRRVKSHVHITLHDRPDRSLCRGVDTGTDVWSGCKVALKGVSESAMRTRMRGRHQRGPAALPFQVASARGRHLRLWRRPATRETGQLRLFRCTRLFHDLLPRLQDRPRTSGCGRMNSSVTLVERAWCA